MAEEGKKRVCVIAVDGSKHSDQAVTWYKENLHRHGDHVVIVNCVDHRKHLQYGTIAMAPGNPDSVTHAFQAEDKKANELLKKTREKMKEFGLFEHKLPAVSYDDQSRIVIFLTNEPSVMPLFIFSCLYPSLDVSLVSGDPNILSRSIEEAERQAHRVLNAYKEMAEKLQIEAEFVKMSGDPGECIIHKAEESGAEFIVTGCRGLGTIRRTIMGSVSDYIMHHSKVPVFVCRH